MLSDVNLRKTGQGWEFASEADLEDFVWANLERLLGLTPLNRQYFVKSEVCDILALGQNGQLVVLELKNTEDRYIVQQLTRYYDNLLEEKPFLPKVDYGKSIRLIAIAPIFHRHNEIDRKHHKLSFEFLLFEVIQEAKTLYFKLKNTDKVTVSKLIIPYPEEYIIDSSENIPRPRTIPRTPRALQRIIENHSTEKQEIILKLRDKLLRFDERMGEKSTDVTIIYGKNKGKGQLCKSPSKLCAGFHSQSGSHYLELFLYLPFPKKTVSKGIMKIRIITNDWQTVSRVDIPYRYRYPYINPGQYCDIETYLTIYERITGKQAKSKSVDALVDIALEEWLERL